MSKQLKAGIQYMIYDYRYSLTVFWSVLISTSILLFVVALSFENGYMNLAFGAAAFIYCGISGFQMTKETLPFFLKLSSTRKNFLTVAFVFSLLLSLFMSSLAVLLTKLFNYPPKLFRVENFEILYMSGFSTLGQSWYYELFLNFVLCFFVLSIGFLLSSLFYRLGLIGGFSGLAVIIILFLIPNTGKYIFDLFIIWEENLLNFNYTAFVLVAVLAFIPNWLLIRKAPTKAATTR